MPYLMGGHPSLEASTEAGLAAADAGADLIELGIPFSDPLADGPVIHEAASQALAAGVTPHGVLGVCEALASRVPVVLMVYTNVVLSAGAERFALRAAAAGASGLIVPDLPHDEAGGLRAACDSRGWLSFRWSRQRARPSGSPTSARTRAGSSTPSRSRASQASAVSLRRGWPTLSAASGPRRTYRWPWASASPPPSTPDRGGDRRRRDRGQPRGPRRSGGRPGGGGSAGRGVERGARRLRPAPRPAWRLTAAGKGGFVPVPGDGSRRGESLPE